MYEYSVALLIALFPVTATGASPSVPPVGAHLHYISGLCCVCDQLYCSHHFSLQEEVKQHFEGLCSLSKKSFNNKPTDFHCSLLVAGDLRSSPLLSTWAWLSLLLCSICSSSSLGSWPTSKRVCAPGWEQPSTTPCSAPSPGWV